MAFIREKFVKGIPYYQLVSNSRDPATGKVRQFIIHHFGTTKPTDQVILKALQASIAKGAIGQPQLGVLCKALGISDLEQLRELTRAQYNTIINFTVEPEKWCQKQTADTKKAAKKVGTTKEDKQMQAGDIAPEEDEEEKEVKIPIDSKVYDEWEKLISCSWLSDNKARGIIEFENKLFVATSGCFIGIEIEEVIPAENYYGRTHTYNQIPLVNCNTERFYDGVKFQVKGKYYVFVPKGKKITLIRGGPDVSTKKQDKQVQEPFGDIPKKYYSPNGGSRCCLFGRHTFMNDPVCISCKNNCLFGWISGVYYLEPNNRRSYIPKLKDQQLIEAVLEGNLTQKQTSNYISEIFDRGLIEKIKPKQLKDSKEAGMKKNRFDNLITDLKYLESIKGLGKNNIGLLELNKFTYPKLIDPKNKDVRAVLLNNISDEMYYKISIASTLIIKARDEVCAHMWPKVDQVNSWLSIGLGLLDNDFEVLLPKRRNAQGMNTGHYDPYLLNFVWGLIDYCEREAGCSAKDAFGVSENTIANYQNGLSMPDVNKIREAVDAIVSQKRKQYAKSIVKAIEQKPDIMF